MAYMQWSRDLESGIHVIDMQHRRIVDFINELELASQTHDAGDARRVLDQLVEYTVTHFQFEEELQERAQYPFLKAHRRVHEIFKKRVAGFLERADAGEDIVPELMLMLKVWLSSHIKGDDRDYVDSIQMLMADDNQESAAWLAATLQRHFGAQAPATGGRE